MLNKNIVGDLEIVLRLAATQMGVQEALPCYEVKSEDHGRAVTIRRLPEKERPIDDVLREVIQMQYDAEPNEVNEMAIQAIQEVAATFFNKEYGEL